MEFVQIGMTHGEGTTYPSIGKCIYCGRDDVSLTDEHIIPFGVTADAVVFKEASCDTCRDIINKDFEQYVLRQQLGPFRALMDSPTRNPKDRQKPFKLKIGRADNQGRLIESAHTIRVAPKDVHLCLLSWRLPPAGICFEEPPPRDAMRGTPWCRFNSESLTKHIKRFCDETGWDGRVAYKVGDISQTKFMRFLAKIAHGYAIAEFGYDGFEHFLPNIILGKSKEFCHYIGGQWEVPPPGETVDICRLAHGRFIDDERTLLAVHIHLFPFYGSPIYEVVVGQRERTADDIAVRENTAHGSDV